MTALCNEFFGGPMQLEVQVQEPGAPGAGPSADPESVRLLRQQALQHPGVNAALELLDGEIIEIRPLPAATPTGAPR